MQQQAKLAKEPAHSTREKILHTAQRLFRRHGYSAVGINTLCHEAAVVKGSFYHFFPSKQALLDAVIERNRSQKMDELETLAAQESDGRKHILAQFSEVLSAAAEHQNVEGCVLGCSLGSLASELAVENADARTATATAFREWQGLIEADIRAGIADGSIAATVNPKATAWCILAVIQGMSTLGRSCNDPAMLEDIAQTAVKRLLPVAAQQVSSKN